MKNWLSARTERILLTLFALRLSVLAVGSFLNLSFPDVWRQVLCLSVSFRYWSRWTLESHSGPSWHLLLPAILDSGELRGITPMELPLLYWLTAPFFALGPAWGRGLAILVCAALAFGLCWACSRVWKGKSIGGVDPGPAMLLLPIAALSVQWSGKYMPDFLSVILVTLAIGLSWDSSRSRRLISSFCLAAVGMSLKPTAVIVFAMGFAHPHWRKRLAPSLAWILPSVGAAYLYYSAGVAFLDRYRDVPLAVGLQPRSPVIGFMQFFRHLPFVLDFYFKDAFFLGGILVVLGSTLWLWRTGRGKFPWLLWLISFGQFLTLTMLDGGALFFDHRYYLLALAPVLAILFFDAIERSPSPWIKTILMLGVFVPLAEASLRELKPLYRHPRDSIWSLDAQVAELKGRHPEFPWGRGQPFRSTQEPASTLALFFGEITGSTRAPYGFFYSDQEIPRDCRVVDQTINVAITRCGTSGPSL